MRIEDLEFHAPASLAEASVLLERLKGDAKVLAGGTDVLADLKQGLVHAGHLVSLHKIEELKRIEEKEDGLWIGALVTAGRLAESETVRRVLPALAEAAASMAGTPVRNLATIGGNLASAVPSADLPPSLLAADAELLLAEHDGERRVAAEAFFTGPRETVLRPGEILAAVRIPPLPPGTGTAYKKYQLRAASALAVVGVAARLTVSEGAVEAARIAVGAAAPTAVRIEEAEAFLQGKPPRREHFERAGEIAATAVKPITDVRGTAEYRRALTRVLTARALATALRRSQA